MLFRSGVSATDRVIVNPSDSIDDGDHVMAKALAVKAPTGGRASGTSQGDKS